MRNAAAAAGGAVGREEAAGAAPAVVVAAEAAAAAMTETTNLWETSCGVFKVEDIEDTSFVNSASVRAHVSLLGIRKL